MNYYMIYLHAFIKYLAIYMLILKMLGILDALDTSIWDIKITSIRKSNIISTLPLDVLYSKFKIHELDIIARKHGSKSLALTS